MATSKPATKKPASDNNTTKKSSGCGCGCGSKKK